MAVQTHTKISKSKLTLAESSTVPPSTLSAHPHSMTSASTAIRVQGLRPVSFSFFSFLFPCLHSHPCPIMSARQRVHTLASNQVSIFFLFLYTYSHLHTSLIHTQRIRMPTHPHTGDYHPCSSASFFSVFFFFFMLIRQLIRVRTQPICTPMSTIQIQNLYLVSFHFFHLFFLFAFFFSSQSSASIHQHVCTQRIRTLTPSDHLQGRCLFCLFFILIFVHQLCIRNASARTRNTSTSPIHVRMLCPPPFPSVSSFFFVFVYTNLCLHTTHLMHTQGHPHARRLRLHPNLT